MLKLLIGGDVSPTKRDKNLFIKGDAESLFTNILPVMRQSDYFIANLETPVNIKETPIIKSGAAFSNSPEIVNLFKYANIKCLNLSNNHILDQGSEGLKCTFETLKNNNIEYTGAGHNISEARKPFIKEVNNIKLGILSYCEHEFSYATEKNGGANPLDLIDFSEKIAEIKDRTDFIILLYHGGKEHYPYPTPKQQRLCRHFVNSGVNMVVCQHSHIVGAVENYNDKGIIFYGQGNFLFDPYPMKQKWLYKGFLINIEIESRNLFKYNLIPCIHNSFDTDNTGLRLMNNEERQNFENEMESLSRNIINSDFIMENWDKECKAKERTFLSIIHGDGRLLRKINEKTSYLRCFYRKQRAVDLYNKIKCETHLEMLQNQIENMIKK